MRAISICLMLFAMSIPRLCLSQECSPIAIEKFHPDPIEDHLQFGHSVAVNSEFLVVGANYASGPMGEEFAGEVYVYKRSGGGLVLHQRLFAPNVQMNGDFGWSMDMDEETLVIGAPRAPGAGGYAYVLSLVDGMWQPVEILQAIDGFCCGVFGFSVAVDDGLIAVSSPGSHTIVNDSGAVHIFHRIGTAWVPGDILVGSTTVRGDELGNDLELDRNRLIVGAQFHGEDPRWSGGAYILEYDGEIWNETAALVQDDPTSSSYFGSRVSIHDGWAAVSAAGDSTLDTDSGAVYMFEHDGTEWNQHSKLIYENSNRRYAFGKSIDLYDDTLVIASPADDLLYTDTGVVYIYRRSGNDWVRMHELRPSDPRDNQNFGNAIMISDNMLAIGAYRDDSAVARLESGSAVLYDLACPDQCLADMNDDGMLDPADFSAWMDTFNENHPRCDQNDDGVCSPQDFTAWIANFNAGCP